MTLEDRYVTPTPEGVSLDAVLAGLGSRFAAFLLDLLIQVTLYAVAVGVVFLIFHGGGETSGLIATGILALVSLVDFIGYFIMCEMLWSGRSVGKRAAGIRVVRASGAPVGFWSSLLRNIMRLVDSQPGYFYLVGSVLILSTPKNQRLGDLLGNTVVIRERQAAMTLQHGTPFNEPGSVDGPRGHRPVVGARLRRSSGPAPRARPLGRERRERPGAGPGAGPSWPTGGATPRKPATSGRSAGGQAVADGGRSGDAPHPEQFLEAVAWVKSVRG